MSYIDTLSEQMNLKDWPHQFTKEGKSFQVGEQDHDPIFAQPMICVHCHAKYVAGQTQRPPDPCPARNKKRETKRILS